MRIFQLLVVTLLFCAGSGLAEETFPSVDAYAKWANSYYQNPTPHKILPGLAFYPASELYNDTNTIVPSSHFYAALLRRQPQLLSAVYQLGKSNASPKVKFFILNTLWLVNSDAAAGFVSRAKVEWGLSPQALKNLDKVFSTRATWALDTPVRGPLSLDILWAIFAATGDRAAVEKIISVLHWTQDGKGEEVLTASAAEMSLTSQAFDSADVLRVVRESAAASTGATKAALARILFKVESFKAITEKKGGPPAP
jgi:hypothetical protein